MSLTLPSAISVVGEARLVRHLRLSGQSYVFWSYEDVNGVGVKIAVRRRTGVVSLIPNTTAGLRTDGTDFSEQVLPVKFLALRSMSATDIGGNSVLFLVSDGLKIVEFTWHQPTNTITSPPADLVLADQPSVYVEPSGIRKFYVRDSIMYLRSGTSEIEILDLSSSDTIFSTVTSVDPLTSTSRFVGSQIISDNLALKMSADAQTAVCFNGESEPSTTSQGLPAGTIAYWTFDTVDSGATQVFDVVGGNTGTVVGSSPTSTPGKIGQARNFSSGGGYYNVGNAPALRLNGSMSLAFWIRPDNFSERRNPYNKAYGGEGSITIETDATLVFYYGSSGADANPYNGYSSVERLRAGEWQHVCVVRDMTNRVVKWYFNGRLVSSKTAHASTIGVSGNSVSIGRGYTGLNMAGDLDDMVVSSQAWPAETVYSVYAKGAAGDRLSTTALTSSTKYLDKTSETRHFVPALMSIPTSLALSASSATNVQSSLVMASSEAISAPTTALTIEARFTPRSNAVDSRNLVTTYVEPNSSGTRLGGSFYFRITPELTILFGFDTGSATVEYRQYDGLRAFYGRENHLAISHTFGSPSGTFMSVNGSIVNARWAGGSGNESLPILSTCLSTYLCQGDEISGLRVSPVARDINFIRTHLRGRS